VPPRLSRGRVGRLLNKPHYLFRPQQVFARIAYAAQSRRLPPGETWATSLPWGLELGFVPSEAIGSSIARTGIYDLLVSEALWRLTDPGDVAVDAGANIGHMTSVLALRAGPSGRVLAFEPHPALCDLLRQNVTRWPSEGVAPVKVHEAAVSDRSGAGWLNTGERFEENMGSAEIALEPLKRGQAYGVALVRLDEVLRRARVGLLKLDVEGQELAALQGAEAAISERRVRDIVFESQMAYPAPVTDLLEAAGYHVFALKQKLLGPELLGDPGARSVPPAQWEPPSCLATLDPGRARLRFRPRGWATLRTGKRPK
jgi:FkbM family methyltransferase